MNAAEYAETVARDYRDYRRAEVFAAAMTEFVRRLVQNDDDDRRPEPSEIGEEEEGHATAEAVD